MLRTNLEFANLERGARSIMVTSGLEEEGKSTTVANLAIAFARTGKRVALVDLDLRRPSLARFFDLNGRPGLTDVALGHVDLDEALATVRSSRADDDDPETNGGLHFNGNVGMDGAARGASDRAAPARCRRVHGEPRGHADPATS